MPTEAAPKAEATSCVAQFEIMLENLAEGMRIFDARDAEVSRLGELWDRHAEELEQLDLQIPALRQSEETAYEALGLVLAQRKMAAVRERACEQLDSLDVGPWSGASFVSAFRGTKLELVSLDPERYKIGAYSRNAYGVTEGLGKWDSKKKGKLENLNIDPQFGGFIAIKGLFGHEYATGALIDRSADYSPTFTIREV